VTYDILQAAMFGLTDTRSLLQEATAFINVNLNFHGSFNGEDHKITTLCMTLLTCAIILVS